MPRLEGAESYKKASKAQVLKKAREVVQLELERCNIFDLSAIQKIPKFHITELTYSRVVGRGGFCVVREITAIKLKSPEDEAPAEVDGHSNHSTTSSSRAWNGGGGTAARNMKRAPPVTTTTRAIKGNNHLVRPNSAAEGGTNVANVANVVAAADENTREQLARRVWSKRDGRHYVLKRVEPELYHSDRATFLKGIIDLALETHFLASMTHHHILKLRGMSRTDPFRDINGYFLILDQLQEILPKRLNAWMHRKRATKGITGVFTGGRRNKMSLFTERLLVAYDVAEALDYLHNKRIVYRDLKPDNIGFDSEGILKIFDFGLAKELRDRDRCDVDEHDDESTTQEGGDNNNNPRNDGYVSLYRMTGLTGAIRYMAPEVGRKEPYNLKADVYSWSMLMWYIMALEPPMGFYTPRMFIDRVFIKGYRPAIKEKWPAALANLMRSCWSDRISDRPNFQSIMLTLTDEVANVDPQVASFMGETGSDYCG